MRSAEGGTFNVQHSLNLKTLSAGRRKGQARRLCSPGKTFNIQHSTLNAEFESAFGGAPKGTGEAPVLPGSLCSPGLCAPRVCWMVELEFASDRLFLLIAISSIK